MLDPRDNPPAALLERFRHVCAEPSDINEHLGLLYGLARQCDHVTEFGLRDGASTTALLAAQPATFVGYDKCYCPAIVGLMAITTQTAIQIFEKDSREVEIAPTDFLHIDTIHAYSCLSVELRLHAPKVRQWIAMHDTQLFGERGDDGGEGMNKAIDELIAGGKWQRFVHFPNNNGMTVLQRIAEE